MIVRHHGEIIWRITYHIDVWGDVPRVEPVILLLADKNGWRYLAGEFTAMANSKVSKSFMARVDPENHIHLSPRFTSTKKFLNRAISHRFEFQLGLLTPRNRSQVLKKYKIKRSPAEDLQHLFSGLIRSADRRVRSTNRLIKKISKEPETLDKKLHARFGVNLSKPRTAGKKRKQ